MADDDTTTAPDDAPWPPPSTWDLIHDGELVSDLTGLAAALDMEQDAAARVLLDSEAADAAPEDLRAAAQALLDSLETVGAKSGEPGDVEGKDGNPFADKKPAGVKAGSFVTWGSNRGRVELVVSNGDSVPGVDGDAKGTKEKPLARVRVWSKDGKGWKQSDSRVAVPVADLTSSFPLGGTTPGKKSLPEALVTLVASHTEQHPDAQAPGGDAVKTVYGRGVKSYPGSALTSLTEQDWALGRVSAFLAKSAGAELAGYVGDDDLLPAPAAT